MPVERYFIEKSFSLNESCELSDQEFHHLIHVMRNKVGERIELVNGKGELAQGTLQVIHKKHASISVEEIYKAPSPTFQIILAQALPRANRLDFILEKGTELGMTELWLFPGKHGERKELTSHQIERMQTITIAAMKQCGRLFLPKILAKPSLEKWEHFPPHAFFGDLSPEAPLFKEKLSQSLAQAEITFFVGPESGFNEEEIQLLKKHAEGVKLHPYTLRTETAALCALSLISAYH